MSAAFKLTRPEPDEDALHVSVAQALGLLLLPPAEWTCFPAGNVELPPHAAAKLSRMGLKRGWPDFLILFGGACFGLELKRRDGVLSRTRLVRTKRGSLRRLEGQAEVFPRLRAAGMKLVVCRDVGDVLAQCRAWGLPMRARPT